MKAWALGLAGVALLGGCTTAREVSAPVPRLPAHQPARPHTPSAAPGDIIGQNAAALTRQFGQPALDIREGTARKLQFESAVCVLDAYLYPPAAGGDPIVTHVDARLPDGRDLDRASCIAALHAAHGR